MGVRRKGAVIDRKMDDSEILRKNIGEENEENLGGEERKVKISKGSEETNEM